MYNQLCGRVEITQGQKDGEGYVAEILAVHNAYDTDQPVSECYDSRCVNEKLNKNERVVGQHSSYICLAKSAKVSPIDKLTTERKCLKNV